ncbi:hypothetical protein [Yersinia intermedia]|uniref:hypothetical protein n=1 Tax=Yersinia intermedia TaxID=631 RepID=UPI00065CCCC8|nr:hypothetical protein [Yersinia intermedia]CRY84049.1 Uncharacterised protein [Yersinia intermedia]
MQTMSHDFKERKVDNEDYECLREFDAPKGKTYQFCEHSIYVYDEQEMYWEFLVHHWLKEPTAQTIWTKMVELGIFSEVQNNQFE